MAVEPALQSATLRGACVAFAWSDGVEAQFAAAWLLDNAASARAPGSGQRLRTARSLAAAGPIRAARIDGDTVRLTFEAETAEWTGAQLRRHAARRPDAKQRILWPHGSDIAPRPVISYDSYLADDTALRAALAEVAVFGIARLGGAGTDPEELERAVARFGFVRETNYGRLFEVRVRAAPDNLADTARALEPHSDNPYRDPMPTLQLLHGMRASGEDGATVFLDGFALAEWLRDSHPQDFARLARCAVPFTFTDSAGRRYAARSPVLRTAADGALTGLRCNHRSLGAVDFDAAETALWYEAYLTFMLAADAPERQLSVVLRPGDIAIFDNERILHGRRPFIAAAERLLKGCYADRDALRATLARLDQACDGSSRSR